MKAGTIFLVTTGEYSDYGVYATLRAKVDFDFDATLAQWLAAHPEDDREYGFSDDRFMSDLILSGVVEEVTVPRLHLSNYSTPEKSPEKDASESFKGAWPTWVQTCLVHEDCASHPTTLGRACSAASFSAE